MASSQAAESFLRSSSEAARLRSSCSSRARGGQGGLALGQAARQAGGLRQRLLERGLQGALLGLQQRDLFPRQGGRGLQLDDPFVANTGVLGENLVLLAQRAAAGSLVSQLILERGDGLARGHDCAGEIGLAALELARIVLQHRQFPAQARVVALQLRRLPAERLEFAAQRVLAGANIRERVAQAGIVGLFLLQRPQRLTDRADELLERALELVERTHVMSGVDQQVAQRLVVLADTGAEIGECRRLALALRAVRTRFTGRQARTRFKG